MRHRNIRFLFTLSPLLVVLAVYSIASLPISPTQMLPLLLAVPLAFFGLRWLHARMTGFVDNYTQSVPLALMFLGAVFALNHAMQEPGSLNQKILLVLMTLSTVFAVLYMRSYLDPAARNRFVDRSIVTPAG